MNKKADMGIGTLILFIAFILVAAVAAGVLISTTGALQSKALDTGKATVDEVGTSMTAVEIYGEDATDNSNDHDVDYFYQTIKLASGSEPVKFSDLLLTMNTKNSSQEYTYSTSINCSVPTDTTGTAAQNATSISNSTYATNFGIGYSLQASNSITGYMVSGDVVKLCYKSSRSIGENEDVKFNIVPKVGAPLIVDTTMPALMIDKRIYVFP